MPPSEQFTTGVTCAGSVETGSGAPEKTGNGPRGGWNADATGVRSSYCSSTLPLWRIS